MSTTSVLEAVKSNWARQCPVTLSGTASVNTSEKLPDEADRTGCGLVP